jgi:hypothetical protein
MANFHPELFYSNGPEERKIIQKGTATVENKFGSTTILVDDYENITESTLNGQQNDEETLKSGYHRSQSPGMHSSNTNGLVFFEENINLIENKFSKLFNSSPVQAALGQGEWAPGAKVILHPPPRCDIHNHHHLNKCQQ